MSENRYSIDEILKKADIIRSGGKIELEQNNKTTANEKTVKTTVVRANGVRVRAGVVKKEPAKTVKMTFPKSDDSKQSDSVGASDVMKELASLSKKYTQAAQAENLKTNEKAVKETMKPASSNVAQPNAQKTLDTQKTMQVDFQSIKNRRAANNADLAKTQRIDDSSLKRSSDAPKMSPSFTNVERPNDVRARLGNAPQTAPRNSRFIKGTTLRKNEKTAEIFFSKEPPSVIERSAVIKGKTKFEKTADLQAIPEIMAVEDFEKTLSPLQNNEVKKEQENPYVQMKLDGFDEPEEIPTIDEETAEKELGQRRAEKVSSFKLNNDDVAADSDYDDYYEYAGEEENGLEPIEDYSSPRQRESVRESLALKIRRLSIRKTITGIFVALMAAVSVLNFLGSVPSFMADPYAVAGILTGLAILTVLFNLTVIKNGIVGLFKGKPDSDFPLLILTLLVGAQTTLYFFDNAFLAQNLSVFPLVLGIGYYMNIEGKQMLMRRIASNFDFMVSDGEKFTVIDIADSQDSANMCRGLLMGDPVVKHGVKTKIPSDFLKIAYAQEPSDAFSSKLSLVSLAVSAAVAGIAYYITRDVASTLTAATCTLCIGTPISMLYSMNAALKTVSKRIGQSGAMVNGFAGVEAMEDANAIVFDAADLFPEGTCSLHGIKTFGGMRVDDAILHTAAVVISSNGPLKDVFDKVIVGKQSILPDVDDLVYEERMGTSGWIYGKKVLVGNRKLLMAHGVKVPGENFEAKYKKDNRQLLYLAIAGKIAAMFVVSYKADEHIRKELVRLEKSGMTVLVRTNDSNIDEDMITKEYELEEGFVRVLNSASGRIFQKYSDIELEQASANVVYNGTANAFVSAISACHTLDSKKRVLFALQIFAAALGMAMALILTAYNSLSQLSALAIVIYHIVWTLVFAAISKSGK